jgi:hypothetical protein
MTSSLPLTRSWRARRLLTRTSASTTSALVAPLESPYAESRASRPCSRHLTEPARGCRLRATQADGAQACRSGERLNGVPRDDVCWRGFQRLPLTELKRGRPVPPDASDNVKKDAAAASAQLRHLCATERVFECFALHVSVIDLSALTVIDRGKTV